MIDVILIMFIIVVADLCYSHYRMLKNGMQILINKSTVNDLINQPSML